jgi:hypothetical protein
MRARYPTGGDAVTAWLALDQLARADALEAARRGAAPADLNVAVAAVAYGETMARRMRAAMVGASIILVVTFGASALSLMAAEASGATTTVTLVLICVGYWALAIALAIRRSRFVQLATCGVLGIEAAPTEVSGPIGAPAPQPSLTAHNESEFTVPRAFAAAQSRPDAYRPNPATPTEVRIRRGRLMFRLALVASLTALCWTGFGWLSAAPKSGRALPPGLLLVIAIVYTLLFALLLVLYGRLLTNPVVARFSADGWHLPVAGVRGTWQDVQAIEVRAVGLGHAQSGIRLVALHLDEPQRHVAQLNPLRRRLARQAMRRYGTPALIAAHPRRTVPVAELLRILQRHTDAPVS